MKVKDETKCLESKKGCRSIFMISVNVASALEDYHDNSTSLQIFNSLQVKMAYPLV